MRRHPILCVVAAVSAALFLVHRASMGQTGRAGEGPRLMLKASLRVVENKGTPYALNGAAKEGELGDPRRESAGRGIILDPASPEGSVCWQVTGLDSRQTGRWYSLRIRALAQEGFAVKKDDLYLRVDFASAGGTRALDHVTKSFYEQVERDRADLADKQTNRNLGPSTWRNYAMQFRLPFAEIDSVRLTAGFANGAGKGNRTQLWISEVELAAISDPSDYAPPPNRAGAAAKPPALETLVPIGGRWHYDPRGGAREIPAKFDHSNADRLYYLAGRLEAPFAGNMSAWRRKGYLDRSGAQVKEDQFVEENVVITFTTTHLVMKSRNLPNHPTAVFPDRWRFLDGNPNYIQEQDFTWHIPLNPKENPRRTAMDAANSNRALPGGAIGVAVNGVILHNPFDELVEMDAVWRTDRCCGHPSPLQSYHYHKYPVCLNTPWADDGEAHSPLIGFMFDGFPVYGPYESAGEMAQHSKTNPLNEFNVHYDEARGWHYHVTPGKYPHLIGGFWGELEQRNRTRRGPPPRPQAPGRP